jgi:hypothetical protein
MQAAMIAAEPSFFHLPDSSTRSGAVFRARGAFHPRGRLRGDRSAITRESVTNLEHAGDELG